MSQRMVLEFLQPLRAFAQAGGRETGLLF